MNGREPLLERCHDSAHPDLLARLRQDFGELLDPTFQFGITGSQPKRRLVLRERVRYVVTTTVDVAHRAKGCEICRRTVQNSLQLLFGFVELTKMEQGSTERDASGEVTGMSVEAVAADVDGFLMAAEPPALFGELRKRNRRRIFFDPASKV